MEAMQTGNEAMSGMGRVPRTHEPIEEVRALGCPLSPLIGAFFLKTR